jgi:chromosome segregation ATPase
MDINPLKDTSVAEEVRTINGNLISNFKANEGYHSPSDTLSHWIFPVLLGDESLEKVEAFKKVYAELAVINKKLQIQSIILQKQKMELTQRERALVECQQGRSFDIRQSNMQTLKVEHELTVMTEKQQHDLDKLTAQLQNKNKEMKRMRASFDNLKEVNDKLRRKFMEVKEQNGKLELQVVSVQGRLTNLLRKQSLADRPRDPRSLLGRTQAKTCQQMAVSPKKEANKTSTSNKPPIKGPFSADR